MTERLAEAHLSQRELEGLVTQHETRAQRAETRLAEAQARLQVLEETVAAFQRGDAVVDLVAWDEQTVQKATQKKTAAKRQALKRA